MRWGSAGYGVISGTGDGTGATFGSILGSGFSGDSPSGASLRGPGVATSAVVSVLVLCGDLVSDQLVIEVARSQ